MCTYMYVYIIRICKMVYTHLLGDVEALSRINLCVEKVNCIRERQTTLHLDLYGRRYLARYIGTLQPMQHTVPCVVEWWQCRRQDHRHTPGLQPLLHLLHCLRNLQIGVECIDTVKYINKPLKCRDYFRGALHPLRNGLIGSYATRWFMGILQ